MVDIFIPDGDGPGAVQLGVPNNVHASTGTHPKLTRSFAAEAALHVWAVEDLKPRWKDLRSRNHIGGNMNPTDGRVGYQYSHVRGVGGTTLHYTGSAHRLHPQTMNMRPRFGVAADWPLSYAELDRITARPSV